MQVHRVFCGLQSPDLGETEAANLVNDLAMAHFPNGHTIYEANGRWKGAMVECNERTLIVEVWEVEGFGQPPYIDFAADYKELARQESVVILSAAANALVI